MDILRRWLDRYAKRLCEWLHNFFPGDQALAVVGAGIAGIPLEFPLPVDRTVSANKYTWQNGNAMANAIGAHRNIKKGVDERKHDFWAYCHLKGEPCVWCGGQNNLKPPPPDGAELGGEGLCPAGKTAGTAWFGCCFDPKGVAKKIAFLDCCGKHTLPCSITIPIRAWPDAKDWCNAPVLNIKLPYYCTVVVDTTWGNDCI